MEAGKCRLAGDTVRAATSDDVKVLRGGPRDLKECVADLTLEIRLLTRKYERAWGRRRVRYPVSRKSSASSNDLTFPLKRPLTGWASHAGLFTAGMTGILKMDPKR